MNFVLMLMLFGGVFLWIVGGLFQGRRSKIVYVPIEVPETRGTGPAFGKWLIFVIIMVVLINIVA